MPLAMPLQQQKIKRMEDLLYAALLVSSVITHHLQ